MRKLRQNVDVPLSTVTHDIDQIKKEYSFYKGTALVKALKKIILMHTMWKTSVKQQNYYIS